MGRDFWCDANSMVMIFCVFAIIVIAVVLYLDNRRGGDE